MVELGKISCQGGRVCNEDSVQWYVSEGRCCLTVADGLGGHGGGKTASQTAVEMVTEGFREGGKMDPESVRTLYDKANKAVLACQTPACKMKTTCVALFLEGDEAMWAHVGDSRLYHFFDGEMVFCTRDHSVSQMAVMAGEITPAQVRFHEDRNRVLRALGAEEEVKAEIKSIGLLKPGFHAFLLCTDGFWEYVLEDEMEIDLSKADSPQKWLACMEERLRKKVAKMQKQGENDNYTAAALFCMREENGL